MEVRVPEPAVEERVQLPSNVVKVATSRQRYGVKAKLPWMKNQMRCGPCGSSFTNAHQAAAVAKLFIGAARQSCRDCRILPLAHPNDVIVLDEFEMQAAEKLGATIEMFQRQSTTVRFPYSESDHELSSHCTVAPFPLQCSAASSTSCAPASRPSTSSDGAMHRREMGRRGRE